MNNMSALAGFFFQECGT